MIKTLLKSILAGICIGIGGIVFLSVENKLAGSFLFTVGLFTICTMDMYLFTGKVCYSVYNRISYLKDLIIIWIGNFIGTCLCALLINLTRVDIATRATSLCEVKLNDSYLSLFILGFFCNIMIYIAVESYKNNQHEIGKYLGLVFGIMVFINSGFEHCIADMFYFAAASLINVNSILCLLVITAGNIAGGIFIPLIKKYLIHD